jgi:hypothetical protein
LPLTQVKKLDDCFGQFLVQVSCVCGTWRRLATPNATNKEKWYGRLPLDEADGAGR